MSRLPHIVTNISGWKNDVPCVPSDSHVIAQMVLIPSQFFQWQMWPAHEAHEKILQLGLGSNPANVTYKMLTGTG